MSDVKIVGVLEESREEEGRGRRGHRGPPGPPGPTGPNGGVVVDNKTIAGDGSTEHPLEVIGLPGSQPFALGTVTIYARTTGSDANGDGTLANPYATLQRAVLDVPLIIPSGTKYVIDITGITEVLPEDYTLPAWKAAWTIDSTITSDPNFLFLAAVQIQAIPQLAGLPNGEDVIPVADIASQTADAVSKLIRMTFTTPRASWAANALKGYFIEDSVGGGNNCVIWQSDATHLVLCTAGALDTTAGTSLRITKPGATIRGTSSTNIVATGSARGILRAVNCDSIGFAGLDIANLAGLTAPGLALGGNGSMFAQMCWLSSPTVQSWSPALARNVRCWIKGAPSYSNFVTLQQSLCDAWTPSNWVNIVWMAIRRCVFDGCASIDPQSFFPGIPNTGSTVLLWSMINCVVANTPGATGDGIRLHGVNAQLTAVDVYNCGRDGIQLSAGSGGRCQLTGCGTTSADGTTVVKNTRYGVNVQDGMSCAADATTYGNAKPLDGTTGQTKTGNVATETWAAWSVAKNTYDIVGATATGSRLYGD
jgi:hypothetical protein